MYRRKKKSKRKKELYSESNANTEAGRDATDIQRKGDDRHKISQMSTNPVDKQPNCSK